MPSETNVTGPLKFSANLPRPQPRKPYFGEGTLTPELKKVWQDFYRDVAVLAFPTPDGTNRIANLNEKALYLRDPISSLRAGAGGEWSRLIRWLTGVSVLRTASNFIPAPPCIGKRLNCPRSGLW